jgi:hypothetical protein
MLDCLLNLPQVVRDAAYDNTRAVANSARQLADFEARSAELVQQICWTTGCAVWNGRAFALRLL